MKPHSGYSICSVPFGIKHTHSESFDHIICKMNLTTIKHAGIFESKAIRFMHGITAVILVLALGFQPLVAVDRELVLEIPASQAEQALVVNPVVDSLAEGAETVEVSLQPEAGYLITQSGSAVLLLGDMPAPPDLTGFAPKAGLVGTTVVIRGHAFVGVTAVSFNGTPAIFTVDSPTQITAEVPAGASTGPVAVGTAGGAITSAADFTVVVPDDTWDRYWNARDTGPNAFRLNGVTYADGLFVAVGEGGRITTSFDGIRWKDQAPVTTMQLFGVAAGTIAGKNYFVAAGGGADSENGGVILKSIDGLNWQVIPTPLPMTSVAYGGGRFVVGGMQIMSSPDLTSWRTVDLVLEKDLVHRNCGAGPWRETVVSVGFGGGRFVATTGIQAHDGRGFRKIITSSDGVTWTNNVPRIGESYYRYSALAYAPGFGFLVVGCYSNDPGGAFGNIGDQNQCPSGNISLYTEASFWNETAFNNNVGSWAHIGSVDGKTWTEKAKRNQRGMFGATFGDGIFVTVGNEGMAQITSDVVVWQEVNTGTAERLRGVAYGAGLFVAVGNKGVIVRSSDAVTWLSSQEAKTDLSAYSRPKLLGLASGGGRSIAVGDDGMFLLSTNGLAWSSHQLDNQPLYGVAFGAGKFVAVGQSRVYVSSVPPIWKRLANMDQPFRRVRFLNGNFIAVGAGGVIMTSPDGETWTRKTNGDTSELRDIAFGNGQYVIAGFGGTLLSSADLVTWERFNSGNGANLYGVAFGNGLFVAVGDGIAWGSSTGQLWRLRGQTGRSFRALEFGNNQFLASSENSPKSGLLRTTDGVTWTEVPTGYGLQFNIWAIEVGASTVKVAGDYMTLLESVPYGQQAAVSVSKVTDASEMGSMPGRFLFRRTGDLSKPLRIRIRVGGTAVEPDDYVLTGPTLR